MVVSMAFDISPKESYANNGLDTLKQTSKAFTSVAQTAIPAVVYIKVEKEIETSMGQYRHPPLNDELLERYFRNRPSPNRQPQKYKQVGQGSGFLISKDGYILSNNHVVGDADEITVTLDDGDIKKAKFIGGDPKSDIAVIKIEGDDYPFIELADSDKAEIGEWCIAIGNPFGLNASLTVGVVSAKSRNVGITQGGYEDFIQTDAAINPGNSGGPLLNLKGNAIGINTAIFSRSGGSMGIGFAIPSNMVKNIKDQLINSGKVTRGFIGISMNLEGVTPDLAEFFGLDKNQGVLIAKVLPDTPASKAGLKSGDIILKMNGKTVEGNQSFRNTVALLGPGKEIKLLVLRDDKKIDIKVIIGELTDDSFASTDTYIPIKKMGIKVQELTKELADQLGYEDEKGVIITSVEPDSAASKAGIKFGMLIATVNRKPIASIEDFKKALKSSKNPNKILLLVKTDQLSQYVVINLE